MKFDSGSLWYLENENPSTTESWTDENFDLKNPRYERKKKSTILHLDPFARLGPSWMLPWFISDRKSKHPTFILASYGAECYRNSFRTVKANTRHLF